MSTPFKDDTSYEDIEQHLRSHYHHEFGEPSNASKLWHTLEGQLLPLQQKEMSWWQRCLQVFAPRRANSASTTRRAPARAALGFSLALVALVLVSGVFYTIGLVSFHQGPSSQAVVNNNANDTALLSALLQQNPQFSKLSFTSVNQQKITTTGRFNFQKAYADANNIVLAYTMTIPFGQRIMLPRDLTLTSPQLGNKVLVPTFYRLLFGNEKNGNNGTNISMLAVFDATAVTGNPGKLSLNVMINQGSTMTKFNSTVTFIPGKTITVNKSAVSHGVTMTLNRVVITPSATCFYTSDLGKLPADVQSIFVNGKDVTKHTGTFAGIIIHGSRTSHVVISPAFWLDLRNDTGSWKVELTHGEDTYQFAFNVA